MSDKPLAMQARPAIGAVRAMRMQEAYQQRLESLLSVDDAVESIVSALRSTGELDNTLILFTSDNGFFAGEHRVATGKVLPYEPSIRLPLLMRGPGVPVGSTAGQLVTNADLAPTILDAADATPKRVEDGRSLLELVGDRGVEWGRELLLEGGNAQGLTFSGLRNYRWKYIEHTQRRGRAVRPRARPLRARRASIPTRRSPASRRASRPGSRSCAPAPGAPAASGRRCACTSAAASAASSPRCAARTPAPSRW